MLKGLVLVSFGFALLPGGVFADSPNCALRLDATYRREIERHVAYRSAPVLFATAPPRPRLYDVDPTVMLAHQELLKPEPNAINRIILDAQGDRAGAWSLDAGLRAGGVPARLVVATHVSGELQKVTAQFLATDPRVRDRPRLGLVESAAQYALTDVAMADELTLMTYSLGGEFRYPVTASEIVMIGGNASACLRRSIVDVARAARRAGLREVHLHFMTELVYDFKDNKHVPVEVLRTDEAVDAATLAGALDQTLFPAANEFVPIAGSFFVSHARHRAVHSSYRYAGELRVDVTLESARP